MKTTSLINAEHVNREMDKDSDWFRLPPPGPNHRLWGLSRTTWAELLDSGKIKGIRIKHPGAKKGITLIHRPSAVKYFQTLMDKQCFPNGD